MSYKNSNFSAFRTSSECVAFKNNQLKIILMTKRHILGWQILLPSIPINISLLFSKGLLAFLRPYLANVFSYVREQAETEVKGTGIDFRV